MKINDQINFIVIDKQAKSLYSLIADGKYRSTSLGRNKWMSLIGSKASLQWNCNKEGFNAECTSSGLSRTLKKYPLPSRKRLSKSHVYKQNQFSFRDQKDTCYLQSFSPLNFSINHFLNLT